MPDLSILVPARNEEFLAHTCQDVLAHIEGDTEIIVVIDGQAAGPALPVDPRLRVITLDTAIGQRAAQNLAARNSSARYVMKLDAHCAVEQGFDRKLMAVMEDDLTIVPVMRNLWVFDWVCDFCGLRIYQDAMPKEPCKECLSGPESFKKQIVWNPKTNPQSSAYRFNKNLQFKYFGELRGLQGQHGLQETMSLQGSCFMATRQAYFEKELCDESWGNWGQQGSEVALKTWLSGGRVLCLRDTWYAHLFRTHEGFGHPFPGIASSQEHARRVSKEVFLNDAWPKQTRPLVWLLEKFWEPLSRLQRNEKDLDDWENRWQRADLDRLKARRFSGVSLPTKGIIFYTDNEPTPDVSQPVIDQLKRIAAERSLPIVTAALKRKLDFGVENIYFPHLKRGALSQFKQILSALEHSTADIIFFCEADILYHPSHFDFAPPNRETYYYNVNVWKVRWADGFALQVDDLKQLSGFCGWREHLIRHYRRRIEIVEQRQRDILAKGELLVNEGVSHYMGYEPGLHSEPRGVDNYPVESWRSEFPIIDIRHDRNLTKNRWTKAEFQDQKYTAGWTECTADQIPGWGDTFARFAKHEPTRGMIFYTDNQLAEAIARPVQERLFSIAMDKGLTITTAALGHRLKFGTRNLIFPSLKRGHYAMFKQILGALEHSEAEIVFFTEHDVLYSSAHFDFVPPRQDTYYYNTNVWQFHASTGKAVYYFHRSLSQMVCFRELAIAHYRHKLELIEANGGKYDARWGFEPGTRGTRRGGVDDSPCADWQSAVSNIDIRHAGTLSKTKTGPGDFRTKPDNLNWQERDSVPGWPPLVELLGVTA